MVGKYDDDQTSLSLRLRYNGARLQYLSNWFHLFNAVSGNSEPLETSLFLQDFFSASDIESVVSALEAWLSLGGDLERSWKVLFDDSLDAVDQLCGIFLGLCDFH